jgi:omega-6 fatty acid desaturase (delta-12 desaturase)
MNDDVRGLIPAAAEVGHLKPTVGAGAFHTGVSLAIFAGGAGLATAQDMLAYSAGQLLLAVAFLHAFVLLHEAGHDTLFEQRPLNRLVGHVAGFLTVIPFWNWQRVHARHHRYTGWQDLDATTASLVPRRVPRWQQRGIDFAWATWLPLFALVYRIQNFWNIPRVFRYVGNPVNRRRILINTATVVAGYAALLLWVGSSEVLRLVGPGFLLSLVLQEALILSQHTHVPQRLSGGQAVRPFTPLEQEAFTRSLRLPGWLSTLLMHVDAHELHHMYPYVPGYRLREIDYRPVHEVHWWRWLKAARRLSGTDFLFRNWDDTGVRV